MMELLFYADSVTFLQFNCFLTKLIFFSLIDAVIYARITRLISENMFFNGETGICGLRFL